MTTTARTRLFRRSAAPVLATALALGVALSGCSSSDAGTGDADAPGTSVTETASPADSMTNPNLSRVSLYGAKDKHLEQQIITTGSLDLTDVVTELGFQDEKGDRYTGAEMSPDRNQWPADAYTTQLLMLNTDQMALRWACDAVDGPRLNVEELFCDKGGYLLLLEPGSNAQELPQVAEYVAGPQLELDEKVFDLGLETRDSRMWPGLHPGGGTPQEIMVDGVREQVIAAVQPQDDENLVYFVKPGSFDLYVGQMAEIPEELRSTGK